MNRASDMLRVRFHVCPICGNIIQSSGEAVVSCGLRLPPLEAEEDEEGHRLRLERIEDEYYVMLEHEMGRTHHISFLAAVGSDGCDLRKLYPEGAAQAYFRIAGVRYLYAYCNRHGLFRLSVQ